MNKEQLERYYMALCDALEREVTEVPKTKNDLRFECARLKARLLTCPDGERLAQEAFESAKRGNDETAS